MASLVVALTWMWRTPFPYERVDRLSLGVISVWYEIVGWLVVDHAVFAVGQLIILWLAMYCGN